MQMLFESSWIWTRTEFTSATKHQHSEKRVCVCVCLGLLNKSRTDSGYCGKAHHSSSFIDKRRRESSAPWIMERVWSGPTAHRITFTLQHLINGFSAISFFFFTSCSLSRSPCGRRHIVKRVLDTSRWDISKLSLYLFPINPFLFYPFHLDSLKLRREIENGAV